LVEGAAGAFAPAVQARGAPPALADAQQKARAPLPRNGWRNFGGYSFLEDSRYTSQQENAAATACRLEKRGPRADPAAA
jgi:hypothetical protein